MMAQADSEKVSEKVPTSVSKMVRAVLLSSTKGVPLKKFNRDYLNLVGESFPWRKLGFSSAVSLLQAMPSVVRFEFSSKDGDYRLYGIGDGNMFMPSWVVKAQGNMSHSDVPSMNILTTTTTDISKPTVSSNKKLVYSARGLVTVYVSWCDSSKNKSGSSCDASNMKVILYDLVSEIANPVEILVHTNSSAFVRFSSIEEGELVIGQLNKCEYCGYMFSMMPANEKMPKGRVKPMSKSKKEIQNKLQEAVRNQRLSKCLKSVGVPVCSNGQNTSPSELLNSKQHDLMPQNHFYSHGVDDTALSECSSSDGSSSFEWDDDLLNSPLVSSVNNYQTTLCYEQSSLCNDEMEHLALHQSKTNESELSPVIVSQVNSPDNLWIQFGLDPEAECTKLSSMISHSKPARMSVDQCQIGSFCCVRDSQVFMRARVEDILTNVVHKQVNVLYVDTGEIKVVSQEHVCTLPPNVDIQLVPPLAVPCSLHGIVSTHCDGESWYPLDMQLLWKSLYRRKVYARIVKRTSTQEHKTEPRQNVGVVDLYFDPFGLQSVAKTLVEESIHLDWASLSGSEYDIASDRSSCKSETFESLKNEKALSEHSPTRKANNKSISSPWKRLQAIYGFVT